MSKTMCLLDMIGGGGGEGETGLVDCWIFWIGCFGCRYIRTQLVIALLIYLYLTLSDQSKQTSGSYSMSKSLPGRPTRRRPGGRDYELVDTLHVYLR